MQSRFFMPPQIYGASGNRYRIISGTIRNTAGVWATVEDVNHASCNIESVEIVGNAIRVHYAFTAKKVLGFQTTPDDDYAKRQYQFGTSVGLDYADISCNAGVVGGYVSYNGTTWVVAGGSTGNITAAFSGGTLTMTHPYVPGTLVNVQERSIAIDTRVGSLGTTTTPIAIYDSAGALITTANTNMQLHFTRYGAGDIPPASVPNFGSSNIWIYGIFEVNS